LYDKDLVLWTQLLAETLNARMMDGLRERGHAQLRYSHGFLFQQLVEGPRPVGEEATNLGVTSQAVSKMVRELEALGYVTRVPDPDDARVRRVGLTSRGRAAIEAGRAIRVELNRELANSLGEDRLHTAAKTLKEALAARGAMSEVQSRRVRSAQEIA